MRSHDIKGRVATLRYTSPNMKKFFGCLPIVSRSIRLKRRIKCGSPTSRTSRRVRSTAIWRWVMDRCSRRIVGWAFGRQKNVALTLRALDNAVAKRPAASWMIFHTDRGIEYYAMPSGRAWAIAHHQEHEPSGQGDDNAFMESFFTP